MATSPSPILPSMLRSRCAVRISFRLAPISSRDFRYSAWSAGMHHDLPPHGSEYSLELDTKTAMNYAGQLCVHRLILSSSDNEGKLVELSAHCAHGANPHGCKCIYDRSFYGAIYESLSEVFKNYLTEQVEKVGKETVEAIQETVKQGIPKLEQRSYERLQCKKEIIERIEKIKGDAVRRIPETKGQVIAEMKQILEQITEQYMEQIDKQLEGSRRVNKIVELLMSVGFSSNMAELIISVCFLFGFGV